MIDIKADFSGGLNLDDSNYVVPKNCYIDALNITRDAIAGSNDRAITNVYGNRDVSLKTSFNISFLKGDEILDFTIETLTISAGTRFYCKIKDLNTNDDIVVMDYTSPVTLSNIDYVTAAYNSAASSIVIPTGIASGYIISGGSIANGTYDVSQSSSTGNGYGSKFKITIVTNITLISVKDGGINYQPGDVITIDGAQFGGVTGVDDVKLTVGSVGYRPGISYYNNANVLTIAYADIDYNYISHFINLGHPAGGYICIGAYPNTVRNKIIYFLYQPLGYHMIIEFDILTEINIKIFESIIDSGGIDILNFQADKKITSINVYNREEGDLLFFIDTLGRPTGIDIELFKNGEYTPVSRSIIDVCKSPSLEPPTAIYQNDTFVKSNNLRDKYFRFKYRFVYDDLSKSVCSPISVMPMPDNVLNDEYTNIPTNNNVIKLSYLSGDKNVKKIELMMSYVDKTNDWSDFVIIDTVGKELSYTTRTSYDPATLSQIVTITFAGSAIPYTDVQVIANPLSPITIAQATIQPGQSIKDFVQSLYNSITLFFVTEKSYNDNSITFRIYLYNYSTVNINYTKGNDNLYLNSLFYNDSTYPYVDIEESIQLYDYVPELANAQELANGNVLVYGGITEGYDYNIKPNINTSITTYEAGPTNTAIGNLKISYAQGDSKETLFGPTRHGVRYGVSGSVPGNTTIDIYVKDGNNNDFLLTTYTTNPNGQDNPQAIVQGLFNNVISPPRPPYYKKELLSRVTILGPAMPSFGVVFLQSSPYYLSYVKVTYNPQLSFFDNPIRTFLNGSTRNIGIAYFDPKGKTNGIVWNGKLNFPSYAENPGGKVLLPQINLEINHQPPIWANSYQVYLTKDNTDVLCWVALIIAQETEFLYFDISTLQKNQTLYPTKTAVCSWSFQDGDRLRLLRNQSDGTPFNDTYDAPILGIVADPLINNVPYQGKLFVKIPRKGSFSQSWPASPNPQDPYQYEIQLYRNKVTSNKQIYYEFGQQYYILNPATNNRSHSGSSQDQNVDASIGPIVPALIQIREGDVYFRNRILNNPSNVQLLLTNFFCYDNNITDNYISAVNSVSGRPNAIDPEAKRAYYGTLVRFGQAYQANTNINGFPRFYGTNFDEYDYTYGDIMRFKVRDRFMRAFQKLKVGMVPLYQQMVKNQDSQTLVISDKLLNPIQYYVGDVGIGDNPESLASYNYADYFTSNIKGAICRVSQDGVGFISIEKKINSWANAQVGDLEKRFKIGVFDQRLSNYILYLSETTTNPEVTIVFDEEYNNFETFLSLYPEMMVSLGPTLMSFKNGRIYIHNDSPYNTFYGEPAADSSITPIFNDVPVEKKTFLAISEVASVIWDVPNMQTDLYSYGTTKQTSNLVDGDFAVLEGSKEAAILRDSNSQGGILSGDTMKGKYLISTFRKVSASELVSLNIVSCKYIDSPLTTK